MPIYEFYCESCHTIYNFFSRSVNTGKRPACPRCGQSELERQVSLFSLSKGRKEEDSDDMFAGLDESKMEQALMSMMGDIEKIDEDDPRQAADLLKKMYQATGMRMGGAMEEMISRMEAGEDPEQIEAELGDSLEEGELFAGKPHTTLDDLKRKYLPPKVDERLYEL
ncbi:MAG: zinc ribbon domain-containing protein [Pseudomonadota bacterium]|nr:zinc ribbon domain-containing protein [Pseudomonadota bacterium]